jgi:hypothetical protein
MQSFIVLGIIPGTDFQTTFNFWVGVAASFVLLLSLRRILRMLTYVLSYVRIPRLSYILGRTEFLHSEKVSTFRSSQLEWDSISSS